VYSEASDVAVAVIAAAVEASAVATCLSSSLASTCCPRRQVRRRNRCCLVSSSETMASVGSWVRQHSSVVEEEVAVPGQARPWERCSSSIDETGDVGS
jgi:hypothetical protein